MALAPGSRPGVCEIAALLAEGDVVVNWPALLKK